MTNSLSVYFPENADDFKEGIILLDEAVGRFMNSDHELAKGLEFVISAIVREIADEEHDAQDKGEEE